MSNLTIILTSVLLSFFCCAIFMSAYKEDQKEDNKHILDSMHNAWTYINKQNDSIDILRARVYDLENKIKEMETTDDGK